MKRKLRSKILTKEFLNQKYIVEKLSTYQIAKELNISQCTVYWYIKKRNIKSRTLSQAHKGIKLSKEHIKSLSGKNSGRYLDGRTFKKYICIEPECNNEIPYQTALYGDGRCKPCSHKKHSELMTGRKLSKEHKIKIGRKAENHWNWQGGKSPLGHRIRNLVEYKEWVKEVFKRDYWTCQECGYKGKDIEAHHKRVFAEILAEFLKEYDQFSPIEDKETLLRLAMKYKDFWDINNGQTLCLDCHNETKVK